MSDSKKFPPHAAQLTDDDVRAVSPALEHYTEGTLLNGLWKRPALSPRDRSVVSHALHLRNPSDRLRHRGGIHALAQHNQERLSGLETGIGIEHSLLRSDKQRRAAAGNLGELAAPGQLSSRRVLGPQIDE
jgi:hypothetical protein